MVLIPYFQWKYSALFLSMFLYILSILLWFNLCSLNTNTHRCMNGEHGFIKDDILNVYVALNTVCTPCCLHSTSFIYSTCSILGWWWRHFWHYIYFAPRMRAREKVAFPGFTWIGFESIDRPLFSQIEKRNTHARTHRKYGMPSCYERLQHLS